MDRFKAEACVGLEERGVPIGSVPVENGQILGPRHKAVSSNINDPLAKMMNYDLAEARR